MVSLIYVIATCVLDIKGVFHSIPFYCSSSERAKSGWSSLFNQFRLDFCYPLSLIVYIQCALRSLLTRCWLQQSRFLDPWRYRSCRHRCSFSASLCLGKGGWDVPEYAGCVRSSFEFTAQSLSRPLLSYKLKPQLRWHTFHARPQELRTCSLNKSQANSKHSHRGWSESWKNWWTSGGICLMHKQDLQCEL